MSTKKNLHVVPTDKGWGIKSAGTSKYTKITTYKKDAETYAKKLAIKSKGEVIIHGKDGKIQDRDSYGNDPYPPKDKKH